MDDKKYYWIKLRQDFFDLPTIDWLIDQKNGCEYVVLYQKLCLLTANTNGELTRSIGEMIIPYDCEKIAQLTKFKLDTVVVAMELFRKLGLIYEQQNGIMQIPDVVNMIGGESEWAAKKRDYRLKAGQKKDNVLPAAGGQNEDNVLNNDTNIEDNVRDTSTDNDRTISDKSIEIRDKRLDTRDKSIDYQLIADMYNDTCVSFPRVTTISQKRAEAIRARFRSGYTIDDFGRLFTLAEKSRFLKGGNNHDWHATFDWLIRDGNMAKVLDGNYSDRTTGEESVLERIARL